MAHYDTVASADIAPHAARHGKGMLLAATAVLIASFDPLLVRLARVDAADVLFWRGLFMALSMMLVLRVLRRKWLWQALRGDGLLAPGTALGFASTQALFVMAVMTTHVANVMVIFTAAPLFAAAVSGFFLREWVPARTWVAIIVCVMAIALVFGGSLGFGGALGNALALCGSLVVAINLTVLRRFSHLDPVAIVAGAGVALCMVALPFADVPGIGPRSLAVLALMGLLQMPLALVLVTEATRCLPSAEVLLFIVVEVILGIFWVWWLLGEEPPDTTLVGGILVVATLVLHSWRALRSERSRWPGKSYTTGRANKG